MALTELLGLPHFTLRESRILLETAEKHRSRKKILIYIGIQVRELYYSGRNKVTG